MCSFFLSPQPTILQRNMQFVRVGGSSGSVCQCALAYAQTQGRRLNTRSGGGSGGGSRVPSGIEAVQRRSTALSRAPLQSTHLGTGPPNRVGRGKGYDSKRFSRLSLVFLFSSLVLILLISNRVPLRCYQKQKIKHFHSFIGLKSRLISLKGRRREDTEAAEGEEGEDHQSHAGRRKTRTLGKLTLHQ